MSLRPLPHVAPPTRGPYPDVRRDHRLLGGGQFEERTYVDGRLVDVRVYMLGVKRAQPNPLRAWRKT